MKLPDYLNEHVQKHLGKEALKTQKDYGRGAWFMMSDGETHYVREMDISTVIVGQEVDELINMVREFDPNKQVVVAIEYGVETHMIVTVSLDT